MLNLKVDERMKAALKQVADEQFTSVSSLVKRAIEAYLREEGVDWRTVEPEKTDQGESSLS